MTILPPVALNACESDVAPGARPVYPLTGTVPPGVGQLVGQVAGASGVPSNANSRKKTSRKRGIILIVVRKSFVVQEMLLTRK
jgi:hypothetical protein